MKVWAVAFTAALLLLPAASGAQMPMPANVLPDRVLIADQFIPRRLDLPNVLNVPMGSVQTLPADGTFDYVEVGGILSCSRTRDTVLRVTTLVILPGGYFDCGTMTNPIPSTVHVTILLRNVPIDTTKDPYQWGNGLVNLGKQTRVGATKRAWSTVTESLPAGARTITLSDDPSGWQVGDELLMPDMAQLLGFSRPRREAPVTIAVITGRTVTLSKPLDFEHAAVQDPNGKMILLPYVANLTRNLVITSECDPPACVPGHTANVGALTNWDIEYNELRGVGRTKNIPIDDTTHDASGLITHVGTNQRARYALHDHHAQGFQTHTIGNAVVGRNVNGVSGKWGYSVHQTSDGDVEDNVFVDFPGADLVTEDGSETRVIFRHNFLAYSFGDDTGDVNCEISGLEPPAGKSDNPGHCGNGMFLHGTASTFDANVAINNAVGINLFNQDQPPGLKYPSQPGGANDTPFEFLKDFPVAFTNNVGVANAFDGEEYWAAPAMFPNVASILANNGVVQFSQPVTQAPKTVNLINPTIVCQHAQAFGISAGDAYVSRVSVTGGYAGGCATFLQNGGRLDIVTDTVVQNKSNFDFTIAPAEGATLTNVTVLPLETFPLDALRIGDGTSWDGVPSHFNVRTQAAMTPYRGSPFVLINWNGSGKDYQLFPNQSLSTNPAFPSIQNSLVQFACPDALTEGQCWAQYGIAAGHEAVSALDVVALPGLTSGLARLGRTPQLGPPRLVMTTPTGRAPAIVSPADGRSPTSPYVQFVCAFTGDVTQGLIGMLSIDGGTPTQVLPIGSADEWHDACNAYTQIVTPGFHTLATWRVDAHGIKLAGSDLTQSYLIGPATSAPPLPPPPVVPPPPPPPPVIPTLTTIQMCAIETFSDGSVKNRCLDLP